MANAAARRAATIREYHKARRIERCPPGLVEGAPVTFESLCLAADISASLLQEKDDNGSVVYLLAMEKRLRAVSDELLRRDPP
jgi:hypothetical protein